MELRAIKPSHFKQCPIFGSVLRKSEYETIFRNMIIISVELGDRWGLTIEQYEQERSVDGNYSAFEHNYALKVIDFMVSPEKAQTFSPGMSARFCELLSR